MGSILCVAIQIEKKATLAEASPELVVWRKGETLLVELAGGTKPSWPSKCFRAAQNSN